MMRITPALASCAMAENGWLVGEMQRMTPAVNCCKEAKDSAKWCLNWRTGMRDIRSAAVVAVLKDRQIALTTYCEHVLVIFCSNRGRHACIRAPSYVS